MGKGRLAAGGAIAVFASISAAYADFGGICGKVGGCVPPPRSNDRQPDWGWQAPQNQMYNAYLGNAQQAMRDGGWDAAEGWARRALQEKPDSAEARAILAQIEAARRRRDATAANAIGVTLSNQGDYAGAARKFQEALARDPGDTVIQRNLAYVNRRMAAASISDEVAAAAEIQRLDREASLVAANQVADERSRAGIDGLAGRISGLAWTPCEGLACAQAAIARAAGETGAGADSPTAASEAARIPFDNNRGGITVIRPSGKAPAELPRSQSAEGIAMRAGIEALEKEELALARQIELEGDDVKRAVLIQKKTVTRSKRQAETIRYVSFIARFAADAK